METEDQICGRFEAELAEIAALDHLYYLTPSPSLAERRDYAAQQVQAGRRRSVQLQAAPTREHDVNSPGSDADITVI